MAALDHSAMLRPGLLDGVSLVLAGAGGEGHGCCGSGERIGQVCARLGARVFECGEPADGGEAGGVERVLAEAGESVLLAVDADALFARAMGSEDGARASARGDAARGLRECLRASWQATQAVVERVFLASGRGGRVVYVAPCGRAGRAAGGEHADAARAGLENLARTLSVEWARHGITAVAIAPRAYAAEPRGGAGEAAALTAFLASPAGAYFSGCLLDMRGGR